MRHYAPHNTHVQTWSAPSPRAESSRFVASVRALLNSIYAQLRPELHSTPSHRFSSHSLSENDAIAYFQTQFHSRDHLHVEPRLAALRRWLNLTYPVQPAVTRALLMLMRRDARILRTSDVTRNGLCLMCDDDMTPREESPTRGRSPWVAGESFFFRFLASLILGSLYLIMAVLQSCRRARRVLCRHFMYRRRRETLTNFQNDASCYSAWYAAATTLDGLDAAPAWWAGDGRQPFIQPLCTACDEFLNTKSRVRARAVNVRAATSRVEAVFDVDMLSAKLRELAVLYNRSDIRGLAFALRASLLRNVGGMCHPNLHANSRIGTHQIVEDYVHTVSFLLAYIAQVEVHLTPSMVSSSDQPLASISESTTEMPLSSERNFFGRPNGGVTSSPEVRGDSSETKSMGTDDKLTFLNEARHAYGRTALMLSGGAAMGLHHLGVVKGLLDQDLLPKVVCGTSAGALVASIVGIFGDSEIASILSTEELINPITNQEFSFRHFDEHTSFWRRLRRLLRKGFIQDVKMLQDCLRKNYGDLTFEEAYKKTRRILNITVCPLRSSSHPPLLLNYLTAPHVLIWSAASASCALPLVFAPVELVAKSAKGRMVPYHPDGVRWIDGSISSDVPLSRIGELFNVNHFIVSQTNPHVIPRSMPIMNTRLALLMKSELQFRYWQALQMGLVPKLLTSIFPHFMQPYAGDVTIMPDVRLSDLSKLLSNPSRAMVQTYVRRGEIQTFPFLDRIRLQCLIERTLDNAVEFVATIAKGEEDTKALSETKRGNGLFGRVPSWLWLDTRSILSTAPISAMASRLGKARSGDCEMVSLDSSDATAGMETEWVGGENSAGDGSGKKAGRSGMTKAEDGDDEQLDVAAAARRLDEILEALENEAMNATSQAGVHRASLGRFPGLSDDSGDSLDTDRVMC